MIELFHQLFHRRHFWRRVSYSELSELYVSFLLRTLSLSMIGIFVPIYLYELGYSVPTIALFYAFIYFLKMLLEPIVGYIIKIQGVKRTLQTSYFILIANLMLTLGLSYIAIPLWLVALSSAMSTASFYVAFDLEFSMIKSTKHEGSQLGRLQIVKKIGGAIGPLVGGLIASFISVQLTIVIAMILLLAAAIPLMLSGEIKQSQRLVSVTIDDYVRYRSRFWYFFGWGLVVVGNLAVWPLFIAVEIIEKNVYASLGLIVSLSLILSILSASFFGKIVDNKKGRYLLNYTAAGTFISYLVRPFISSYTGALSMNVASEPLLSGLEMSFAKGFFDDTDEKGKNRLAFLISTRSYIHLARITLFLSVWAVSVGSDAATGLRAGLLLIGLGAILMTTQKFKALR